MNRAYYVERSRILAALNLPDKIPVGQVGEWTNVEVTTGDYYPAGTVTLPKVRLVARGVANRVQAQCPACRKWVRVCALQQHVGTKTCERNKSVTETTTES